MRGAGVGASPEAYRVVDRREQLRHRAVVLGIVTMIGGSTLLCVFVLVFVLSRGAGAATWAPGALIVVGHLVFGVKIVPQIGLAWRSEPLPLLVVDRFGIQLRMDRYGRSEDLEDGLSRGRCVDLPWSEISGVEVGDVVPMESAARLVPVSVSVAVAAEAYLADTRLRLGREPPPGWFHRGSALSGPTVLVAVGLQPWSLGQAEEFRHRMAAVRTAVRVTRSLGRRDRAEQIIVVVDALEGWQQEWAAVVQPLGLSVIVPRRCLDRTRFAAAVRAFASWRSVRDLGAVAPSVQDSPQDLAQRFGREAMY